jgi:DNA invertase Pin-like site-specific DNA recombinase
MACRKSGRTGTGNRAVAYARVSSAEQEREGFSIPAQFRLLRDYARDQGIVIIEEFVDVETAKQSGRTGFGQMVTFLKRSRSDRPASSSRRRTVSTATSRTG